MTQIKLIWFLTTISSVYISCTTPNVLERIFEVFFDNDYENCYISIGREFNSNFKVISIEKVSEIWISDRTTNKTCFKYKNYVIFTNNKNLSKTMNDLRIFIPSQSKILMVSNHQNTRFKELQLMVSERNWDLIVYQEEKIDLPPLHLTTTPTRYYLCLLLPHPQCKKDTSDILQFVKTRTHWSLKGMLEIQNRTLTVATIQNPPYTIVTNDTHVTGVEIELLRVVFPFPIRFKVLSRKSLSKIPVSQNPWKNISEELTKKIGGADIAVSSLWMRRYPHDISYPLDQQCITFIVKRPTLHSEASFLFQTLPLKLWGLHILVLFLIVAVLTTLQSGLSPGVFFPVYNWDSVLLDVVRTFAGSSTPRNLSGRYQLLRFVFLLWLLFCLIMVTCYNAGLTTSLKYPKLTKDVRSFRDMMDHKIPWMDETDGVAHFISSSNDTTSKSLVKLYDSEPNKTHKNYKLKTYNYGFRVDNLPGGYIRNLEGIDDSTLEQFQIVRGCYADVHMVYGLKPNSPLKKASDVCVLRMTQFGFVNRWYRKFAVMKRSEAMFRLFTPNSGERLLTLDFGKMRGAFLLLLVGLGLGLVAFTCEKRSGKNY